MVTPIPAPPFPLTPSELSFLAPFGLRLLTPQGEVLHAWRASKNDKWCGAPFPVIFSELAPSCVDAMRRHRGFYAGEDLLSVLFLSGSPRPGVQ